MKLHDTQEHLVWNIDNYVNGIENPHPRRLRKIQIC